MFVFFPLFCYPMGFEKPSKISPPFWGPKMTVTAKGAFRHHGAVDGITRCLGDGGHSPWCVGLVGVMGWLGKDGPQAPSRDLDGGYGF